MTAFLKVLGNEKASKQIFNISGDKYVTFDGLARACAKVSNACMPYQYHIYGYKQKIVQS